VFQSKAFATFIGVVMALIWHYLNALIVGYFAILRFADQWPLWLKVAAPVALFMSIVVVPSNYIMHRVFAIRPNLAILFSMLTYVGLIVYASIHAHSAFLEMIWSGAFIAAAVLPGAVALLLEQRPKLSERNYN
jgi:hypothetical protein